MLDNLIFSIQNTLPLFLVMATGAILKRKNVIGDTFVDQVSTYLYYIGLPLKLFQSVAGSNIREVADMRFVLCTAIAIVVGFLLAWGFARLTIRDQSQVGTFVTVPSVGTLSISVWRWRRASSVKAPTR